MDQFSAHLDRGWDLYNRGDLAGARMSAEKSLELDSQSPEAHHLLGYIQAAEGNAEDALEHYRQAIELDESFVEAMLDAAGVLIHPLHDFDGALQMVDEALDVAQGQDEIADAMLVKFDAYMHQGDRESAAELVCQLPDGPFESARLEFSVGRARFESGDVDAAEPLLRSAVRRDVGYPEAHYYLGLLHDARGDQRAATLEFLKTRELDLKHPPPRWTLPADDLEKRVKHAIRQLPEAARQAVADTLIVVGDLPGAEIVVDGADPRAAVLLDDIVDGKSGSTPRAGRLFVYQRNLERLASSVLELDEGIMHSLSIELAATFRSLREVLDVQEAEPSHH